MLVHMFDINPISKFINNGEEFKGRSRSLHSIPGTRSTTRGSQHPLLLPSLDEKSSPYVLCSTSSGAGAISTAIFDNTSNSSLNFVVICSHKGSPCPTQAPHHILWDELMPHHHLAITPLVSVDIPIVTTTPAFFNFHCSMTNNHDQYATSRAMRLCSHGLPP